MSFSDCPDCWNTPCYCETGYLGSKIYEYGHIKTKLKWLVKHAIECGSISKAKGAELLEVPLIDMDAALDTSIERNEDGA